MTTDRTAGAARVATRLCCAALAVALSGACAAERDAPAALRVLAASDLQAALPEIAARYEAETGRRVELVFGSTGGLTTQLEHGAPGDLFLAANERFLDRLVDAGVVARDTRRVYALGRLALTWAPGAPPAGALAELAGDAYRTVAIANPEHAPYGVAAREALEASGLWDALRTRLVYGENVTQALQFVRTGNADAGLVALGVVLADPATPYLLLDDRLHAPLRQAAGVLRESRTPRAAREFLDLVLSAEGQAILRRYGFELPDER